MMNLVDLKVREVARQKFLIYSEKILTQMQRGLLFEISEQVSQVVMVNLVHQVQ